jgi:hypothetical protein
MKLTLKRLAYLYAFAWLVTGAFIMISTLFMAWSSPGHQVLISVDEFGEMPFELCGVALLLADGAYIAYDQLRGWLSCGSSAPSF